MTNKQPQYDENFKKNIVTLNQNGKTQIELSKEYGIFTLDKDLFRSQGRR